MTNKKFIRSIIFRDKCTIRLLYFLSGCIILLFFLMSSYFFLSKNEPVNANLLVVEGWLSPFGIEMASKEFKNHQYDFAITTGLIEEELNYYEISQNGYLIFYPHLKTNPNNVISHHLIELLAYNEKGGRHRSHFNFFVNDSLVADIITDKNTYLYKINWKGSLTDIDSFMVQLDDEITNNSIDRNFYIKEIRINGIIHIPYKSNSVMDVGSLDKKYRINNNYDSFAEKARRELIATGIDSALILAVPGKKVSINRTLTSAIAFKEWLKTSNCNVKGINIVSQGIHSRRTWMTYHKILGKTYDIGVISLPENERPESKIPNIFKISYEIIGTLYYWFILTFIHI